MFRTRDDEGATMRRIFMVTAAVIVTACAHWFPTEAEVAEAGKTPARSFSDRWAGRPEDDVLLQYGNPDDVVALSTGNRVLSYHREVGYSRSRAIALNNSASSASDSGSVF